MSNLRARVRDALAGRGLSPLHRFGQNFMVDPAALAALARAGGAAPGDAVVEIGPGTGHLTELLLDAGAIVTAVEIDAGLHRLLAETLVPRGLRLVHGDALDGKHGLHPAIAAIAAAGPWRLIANLPYDAALPILLNAIALPGRPQRIAATIQAEAAERLASRPGQPAWGATACIAQAGGSGRIERRLPPGAFHPPPRVHSAIWTWSPSGPPLPAGFAAFVRTAFAYRRKVLPGALRDAGIERAVGEAACRAAGLDPARRLEQLNPAEMLALHAALGAAGGSDGR